MERVAINPEAFEASPFVSRYSTPEMIQGVYAGRLYCVFNGENPLLKYRMLREKALMYDVPEKPWEISGPDAVRFLEQLFCRTISTLQAGRGRYAIACTPRGGVFMDGILFKLGPDRFWYVQADGAMEAWLAAHSGGIDVNISDPESRVIQIQGPASMDIMKSASGGEINGDMKYFHSGFFNLGGQNLYVSRTGYTGELGYEIYTLGSATDHLALWDHLVAAGEPYGMEISSTASMTIRRMEAGILSNGIDMDPTVSPFEAGLGLFVDRDKAGFIGRSALEGMDRRPRLFGLRCDRMTPSRGDPVLADGEAVGYLTGGVHSPSLDCGIGYVLFGEPGDWCGQQLEIKNRHGDVFPCDIVALPFLDPEKLLVRGKG